MFSTNTKVVYLFNPGPLGGAEKVLISGLKSLIEKGLDVELWLIKEIRSPQFCEEFLSHLEKINIKIKVFTTQRPLDLSLIKRLKQSFIESDIGIIHTHGIKASFYGFLSKNKNSKFILTHHGNTSHTLKVRLYEFIEKQIMYKASRTIAVSQIMKESLIKNKVKRVSLVENLLSFTPQKRVIPNNKKLQMVIIGRLSPEKGHLDLLEALQNLSFNYNLKIIGTGINEQKIIKLAKELKIENKVELLGFKKDIREYLNKADVLLMPSHREGLPMILIEAICTGVPVLGSAVGGLKYLVSSNGELFEAKNTSEITNSINLFNSNKEKYLKNALEMSTKFQKRFHPTKWAEDTINVYKQLLSQE